MTPEHGSDAPLGEGSPGPRRPVRAGPAVAFDLETTGVDPFSDAPVSFAFAWREAGGAPVSEHGLVNPGRAIPPAATRIHGITDAMVADSPDLATVTAGLAARLEGVWREGGVVVGMNVAYDLTMVESLCARLGLATLAERGVGAVVDVLVLDRHVDRYRRGKRTLSDLCAHYGVVLDGAHSAVVDAAASLELFERLVERYPELAVTPTERLTETLAGWHREWLAGFSQYLERKGEGPVDPGRYDWPLHAAP